MEYVTSMSWSEIPNAFAVYLIREGLVVNMRSSKLFSLAGLSCIVEVGPPCLEHLVARAVSPLVAMFTTHFNGHTFI